MRNRLFVNQIIYEFEKIVISLNIRKMTSIRLKEPLLFSKILLAWVLPGLFATTTASKKSWSQIARTWWKVLKFTFFFSNFDLSGNIMGKRVQSVAPTISLILLWFRNSLWISCSLFSYGIQHIFAILCKAYFCNIMQGQDTPA